MAIAAESSNTGINGIDSGNLTEPTDGSSSNKYLLEGIIQLQRQLVVQQLLLRSQESTVSLPFNWSFTQGLVIGQLSVIFVIIVFVKFFVFADPSPDLSNSAPRDVTSVVVRRDSKKRLEKNPDYTDIEGANDFVSRKSDATGRMLTILEKTYYDVDNHSPETLDWFNVLVAQTITQLRAEAIISDNIQRSLSEFLDSAPLPDYLDKISLTEIDVGDDFPIFSNCRIQHSGEGQGRLEAKIDVDLSDTLTLGIDTRLVINYPRPRTVVLPVELCLSIVRFSGCLTVSLINTKDKDFGVGGQSSQGKENNSEMQNALFIKMSSDQSNKMSFGPESAQKADVKGSFLLRRNNGFGDIQLAESTHSSENEDCENGGTALMFSFLPDYRLEFTVKSLIGSRAKLQNVPKISTLVESKLRSWFTERCIEPRFQVVQLPSLWPRRRNTRETVDVECN